MKLALEMKVQLKTTVALRKQHAITMEETSKLVVAKDMKLALTTKVALEKIVGTCITSLFVKFKLMSLNHIQFSS